MEQLKSSIIEKSPLREKSILRIKSGRSIFNSSKTRIIKIYRATLGTRGGQLKIFKVNSRLSYQAFIVAQKIQNFVEQLACFLKERELSGMAHFLLNQFF